MAFFTTKHKTPLGIYIHVPFCRSKCQYCDFYSLACNDDSLMDEYLWAICTHIREAGPLAPNYRVDTVYFGGGTPTFFGADGMTTILGAVRKAFDVADDAEITFEANPDSVSDRLLKRLRAEGFNRVSLGVQSDDDAILSQLGRPHNFADAVSAYQRIRRAGFSNVSLDLMYGLPNQTRDSWLATLETVASLGPEHLSCYGLKVEPGTPLAGYAHCCNLPDDDTQADMYLDTVQTLKEYGYRQYEISNFAKRGKVSRHNMKYWTGGEYLAFGPGGSSDFGGKRFDVIRDLESYIDGIRYGGQVLENVTEIPMHERAGEYLMTRLRTTAGISEAEYEKRYLLPFEPLKIILQRNEKAGFARCTDGKWHLTPKGFLVSNTIISDLLLAQDKSQPFRRKRR